MNQNPTSTTSPSAWAGSSPHWPAVGASTVMGFSLADLFVSALLLGNAGAVLNEDRFLAKLGWGYEQTRSDGPSVKKQIINLLYAVRFLLTIPLMICNIIVIVLKLIFG